MHVNRKWNKLLNYTSKMKMQTKKLRNKGRKTQRKNADENRITRRRNDGHFHKLSSKNE